MTVSLAILFNQSITEGKFPQYLKHACIIPIHMKDRKDDISNYKPISLLAVFSKIFGEKDFSHYLERKTILNSRQFGFRRCIEKFHRGNLYHFR